MIWIVLHWVFIFICKPHWLFHGITTFLLTFYQTVVRKRRVKWKKNIQNVVGVTLMYAGFYICEELYHFAFLPFWAITMVGLRKQTTPILILSITTGVFLHFIVLKNVLGHVLMNIGRLLRTKAVNIDTTILSHGLIFFFSIILKGDSFRFTQREVIGVVSTIHIIDKYERMDLFSLCMAYTNYFGLLCTLLHLIAPYWYNFYENNHFYMVKGNYLFIVPIGILVQRVLYSTL